MNEDPAHTRTPSTAGSDRLLAFVLRAIGTLSLTALIFVWAPTSWFRAIHDRLGIGAYPDLPIADYLARSSSALYALLGGLLWVVAGDIERLRTVILYIGAAFGLLGATLFVIDLRAGMPTLWTAWEGAVVVSYGAVLTTLARRGSR